jgi:hypothetical protein
MTNSPILSPDPVQSMWKIAILAPLQYSQVPIRNQNVLNNAFRFVENKNKYIRFVENEIMQRHCRPTMSSASAQEAHISVP